MLHLVGTFEWTMVGWHCEYVVVGTSGLAHGSFQGGQCGLEEM